MALSGFIRDLGARRAEKKEVSLAGRSDGLNAARRADLIDEYEASGLGWFWASDGDGNLTYVTEAAATAIGVSRDELIGSPIAKLLTLERHEDDGSGERPLGFLLTARSTITDLVVKGASNDASRPVWWMISAKPIFDAESRFIGYRGHGKDVTTTKLKEIDATKLAMYDSLTGLSNRHRMTNRLNSILTAYKAAKRSCALLMLDLDRFKHVNDTLGHPAGDETRSATLRETNC